jgi:hypothetical protein
MSLAFLVPAFLLGLAALAVPVILHLRHRESDQPLRFPSLMFLERLAFRTTKRQRIADWPLLLLRAGALALLAVAFARPFFGREDGVRAAARARAVALLVDRSLSMSHSDVWPAALDSARRVIAQLGSDDRVAVVLFDETAEVVQPLTGDHAAALGALAGARTTTRGTRFAAALRAGRQVLLDARDASHELVIVTDLQRSGTTGLAGLDLPADLSVRAIAVGAARRGNTAVVRADVQRRTTATRNELTVLGTVVTRELDAPRRARLTLTLNGRASGTRDVTLPQSGSVTVTFDPVPQPAGRIRGLIQVEPDALPGDDHLNFALSADDDVRVLLVTPADRRADETLFFEHALAIGRNPVLRLDRRGPAGLGGGGRALADHDLVVLWDVLPPNDALDRWVQQGGGLVLVAGARLAARASAITLAPALLRGTADRLAERGGTLGEFSQEHPVFAAFREAPVALQAARFLRYPRLEARPDAEVLARFDDGLPAIVERRHGAGRVVLTAIPLDAEAGDFPLQPAYLPFLRQLVLHASGHAATPLWRVTGDHWIVRGAMRQPVVAAPGGSILRPPPDSSDVAVAIAEAGFYALYEGRVAGDPVAVAAANPPPGESDLTPVDARELLLGVRQSDSTTAGPAGPLSAGQAERAQSLWRAVLVLVALMLIVETALANRGWRGIAGRAS